MSRIRSTPASASWHERSMRSMARSRSSYEPEATGRAAESRALCAPLRICSRFAITHAMGLVELVRDARRDLADRGELLAVEDLRAARDLLVTSRMSARRGVLAVEPRDPDRHHLGQAGARPAADGGLSAAPRPATPTARACAGPAVRGDRERGDRPADPRLPRVPEERLEPHVQPRQHALLVDRREDVGRELDDLAVASSKANSERWAYASAKRCSNWSSSASTARSTSSRSDPSPSASSCVVSSTPATAVRNSDAAIRGPLDGGPVGVARCSTRCVR